MVRSLWAGGAVIPLFLTVLPTTALIFELPSHHHRRQTKHTNLAQRAKRAAPVLPATWSYTGCYTDSADRTLSALYTASVNMTVDSCVAYCNTNNYIYAGVEYSQECYCGSTIDNGGALTNSGCSMMCAGDSTQVCGGSYRLSLYSSTKAPPSALASYNGWGYQGCYTDSVAARTLPVGMAVNGPLTPQNCLDACSAQGYTYAGLEYADECHCGNGLENDGALANSQDCDMLCAGDSSHLCGAGNRLTLYEYGVAPVSGSGTSANTATQTTASSTGSTGATTTTTTTTPSTTPNPTTSSGTTTSAAPSTSPGWTSLGCYTDNVNDRTLATGYGVAGQMTIEACQAACSAAHHTYAGVEYGQECYCADSILGTATVATDGRCSMACAGDGTEICGGPDGINIYQLTGAQASGPTVLQTYGAWVSQGCYVDSVNSRSLPVGMPVNGGAAAMTVQGCLDACNAASYEFAGVEYAQECYCGTTMPTVAATDGRCDMPCNGDSTHICGGGNGLNVYQYGGTTPATTATTTTTSASQSATTGINSQTATTTASSATATSTGPTALQSYGNWTSQGCWSDNTGARSLPVGVDLAGITTPQRCMDACYNSGYGYAGLEYADECYCGSSIENGGTQESDDGCDMTCNGNSAYYCGGSNRLNLYKYNGTVPPPTNGGTGPGTTAVTPLTTGLPGNWSYNGCWVDNAHGRILAYGAPQTSNNSAINCIDTCVEAGYSIAGTEYTQECYCGNAIVNAGTLAPEDTDCNMACSGDVEHACGGPNRVSVYATTTTFSVYPVPTVKTEGLPGNYSYAGCYAEPGDGARVWPYQIINSTSNSVESCLSLCSLYGYPAAAVEYGEDCWCGDPEDLTENGGTAAPETDCSMPCAGSPIDLCGGVGRFNLYTWSTTSPLFVWNTPSNPGHYEFLIGGLVIPLIAVLGVNDKVVFLEKFGTGPPNSTGAYELDYSLANDFDLAWRTMHVSSDVFCAANLVLPDRSGRILSIGGWSLESTEGVRLYTPSGSPGVNGTTDWEEHWDELHLQQGRWYPSAMVMANGSILVVGGEQGSNGAPVPSLEILPAPEGGPTYLTMDWLQRTDPNNLYPFLFVLPGGGIFVIYYNEARILDEVTFETTQTFPLIPGAVNAVGGRTYPMEGTSVMLPQYAPYTDPVEILTCGGSAFGQAFDNCVSIVPEGAGEWIIERMPTKRVMTYMAPLPDGTYLIIGGAQAGVAGFGLANTPNYQALLYDPSQPRNQRISLLDTTIVARLYHSEAIVLTDGRVLISGSDPEDNINPQEYRIEVYVPPYLTDGRIQPSYTINERDWVYGGQYPITVTLPQGPISDMRVSLTGAVASTHGNSMGNRIFFPAFTCAGNECMITAPPNAHICPPGWFQLWVLDGPTPSYSQWVRIGGDPAELGNWPAFADFTQPGVGSI